VGGLGSLKKPYLNEGLKRETERNVYGSVKNRGFGKVPS